jgi:serine/threonine protein kinase
MVFANVCICMYVCAYVNGAFHIEDDEGIDLTEGEEEAARKLRESIAFDISVNRAGDLWALGCILFNMLYGVTPFYAGNEFLIFEKIKYFAASGHALEYPTPTPDMVSMVIEGLLKANPDQRLGANDDESSAYGYLTLTSLPFFSDIPWGSLREAVPPYRPDTMSQRSFETMYDGASSDWELGEDLAKDGESEYRANFRKTRSTINSGIQKEAIHTQPGRCRYRAPFMAICTLLMMRALFVE